MQPPPKLKDFPAHVVDERLAAMLGASTSYPFTREEDYYEDLRSSRFGVTTKRAGWDALRHYEIAACGAVPCFRDLDRKPASCAPFGLNADNSIEYREPQELLERTASMAAEEYDRLQRNALEWARSNTTKRRARDLLSACGIELQAG